jgi:hypothetical protein
MSHQRNNKEHQNIVMPKRQNDFKNDSNNTQIVYLFFFLIRKAQRVGNVIPVISMLSFTYV